MRGKRLEEGAWDERLSTGNSRGLLVRCRRRGGSTLRQNGDCEGDTDVVASHCELESMLCALDVVAGTVEEI